MVRRLVPRGARDRSARAADDLVPLADVRRAARRAGLRARPALRPFQVAAERVARPFRDAYGYFAGLAHAKSENEKLRRELRDARGDREREPRAAQQARRR